MKTIEIHVVDENLKCTKNKKNFLHIKQKLISLKLENGILGIFLDHVFHPLRWSSHFFSPSLSLFTEWFALIYSSHIIMRVNVSSIRIETNMRECACVFLPYTTTTLMTRFEHEKWKAKRNRKKQRFLATTYANSYVCDSCTRIRLVNSFIFFYYRTWIDCIPSAIITAYLLRMILSIWRQVLFTKRILVVVLDQKWPFKSMRRIESFGEKRNRFFSSVRSK